MKGCVSGSQEKHSNEERPCVKREITMFMERRDPSVGGTESEGWAGWDEAGWQAQPGPAWLFGLVGFIPRAVGGPTGAGMQVVAG